MLRRPPSPPLFPSTTLFRSVQQPQYVVGEGRHRARAGHALRTAVPAQVVADHPVGAGELADLGVEQTGVGAQRRAQDRKSTRLNSSHANISYAVFCLKKNRN